jgi:hypothetical protein
MGSFAPSINTNLTGTGVFLVAKIGPRKGQAGEVVITHPWGGYTLRFSDETTATYSISDVESQPVRYPIPQSIKSEVGRIKKNAALARAFLEYDHQRYTTGTGEAPEIEIPLTDYEALKDKVHRIYMAHAQEVEDIVNGPQ